ncbi:MAG: hypothetical protein ABIG63_07975 [Chloroflexota bacterium]
MWWITEYEAVTLFSLKMSSATASGGKTLLTPTPYALKMALLDIACRLFGAEEAEARWPQIRDLQVALSPPKWAVVTNLFQKVLRPRRNAIPFDQPEAGPFQKTIGYREYAFLDGAMGVALSGNEHLPWLADLLLNINYLGKRGGFMQLLHPPKIADTLPDGYTLLTTGWEGDFPLGTLQIVDDCASSLTFDKANVYSGKSIRMGRERITHPVILPYRPVKSSRSFTLYQRVEDRG